MPSPNKSYHPGTTPIGRGDGEEEVGGGSKPIEANRGRQLTRDTGNLNTGQMKMPDHNFLSRKAFEMKPRWWKEKSGWKLTIVFLRRNWVGSSSWLEGGRILLYLANRLFTNSWIDRLCFKVSLDFTRHIYQMIVQASKITSRSSIIFV